MLVARALRSAVAAAAAARSSLPLLPLQTSAHRPAAAAIAAAAARPFTRSLWVLRGSGKGLPGLLRGSPSVSCNCGGLHTEGDKAFTEFLNDEIKEEKKIQKHKSLPKMSGGWELDIHGTEAKLTRKVAGETITVSFNVNNSIPPSADEPPEGQKDDEAEPELTSTPNFVVEVTKDDTKQTLVLDCHYPEDEVSVALYDHLMDFLADRGVDNTFADELVNLSTALEHKEYIRFLEDLKHFVKCQ
ncbi:hypothetical protein Chor_005948 [Crotalus horridus]